MVNRQGDVGSPAVLAGVVIAGEDRPAREFQLRQRTLHAVEHPDDGGRLNRYRGGAYDGTVALQNLGLRPLDQTKRTTDSGDIEGLIGLVQDENLGIQYRAIRELVAF